MALQPLLIEEFGDQLVATATFKNRQGANADPDTVRWILRAPDGTETPYASTDPEVENPAVGIWKFYFLPDEPATVDREWQVRVEGVSIDPDGVTQAAQGTVRIRGTAFTTASAAP